MDKIIVQLGASDDHFGAFATNVAGLFGAGDTPREALENLKEAIELIKQSQSKEDVPALLWQDYEIEVQYDVVSLLRYYGKIITMPALSRLTGINDKQLHHYMSGSKKPRIEQRHKIQEAFNSLGRELMEVCISSS